MSEALSAEMRDLLALTLVPGLGPRLTAALLNRFGSAAAVRRAGVHQLRQVPHIGPQLAQQFAEGLATVDLDRELGLLEKHRVHLRAVGSAAYPARLATIVDPPHLLYARGTITEADSAAVALVGSRQCTAYGKRMAERLAGGLVRAGFTVVSGLARGIDGAAHRGALQAGGRTLAVLAGGLSRIYPPEHKTLAGEVENNGALLTEASMEQDPQPGMFPARNRIISGLCQAVVIVEAAEKSGALITASHAAEQGRTVLAVPGPADSEASGGTNALIRQGAILCRSVDDILEEVRGVSAMAQAASASPAVPAAPPPGLDEVQLRIWESLTGQIRSMDELAQALALSVPQLSNALMMMEMKKVARRLPGNRYERC
jgi:DNA processing protein